MSTQERFDRKVFVVYGQDGKIRRGVFDFLRSLGLDPLEWGAAVDLSNDPAPYIKTIVEEAISHCGAVIVILSPDEEVILRQGLRSDRTNARDKKKQFQARPNVLLELGMALAANPGRVVIVEVGQSKIPSDIDGIHRVRLGNDPSSRNELVARLKNCGCNVVTTGSDWLTAGDISISNPS